MGMVSISNVRQIYGRADRRGNQCGAAPLRTKCLGAIPRLGCAVAEELVTIASDIGQTYIVDSQSGQPIVPFTSRPASS